MVIMPTISTIIQRIGRQIRRFCRFEKNSGYGAGNFTVTVQRKRQTDGQRLASSDWLGLHTLS
jgi:hypothetical protein